jgi:hypothetical protein
VTPTAALDVPSSNASTATDTATMRCTSLPSPRSRTPNVFG